MLLVSLVVGLQAAGAPDQFGLNVRYVAIPLWGVVAVVVALALRKPEPGLALLLVASIWLISAFLITVWIKFGLG